jgi:hypothetical protein
MADLSVFDHLKSDISYIKLTCFSIHTLNFHEKLA